MHIVQKIFNNLLFLQQFLLINFYLFFDKKKIAIFYYDGLAYRGNLDSCYKFVNYKKISIYTIFSRRINDEFEKKKKTFYLGNKWLKFLKKIDFVISPNVCLNINTKINIYYHHDILDSPIGSSYLEYDNYKAFRQVDYIFVANKIVKDFLNIGLLKFFKKNKIPKIEVAGYQKINKKSHYKKKNTILIAPTKILLAKKNSILQYSFLKKLVELLRVNFPNRKIILRPHPNNRHLDFYFLEKYNVIIDVSSDYTEVYAESNFMITDFSGTAYSYALRFLKPVIFMIKPNVYKKMSDFTDSCYNKNINSIGKKSNLKNLVQDINKINSKSHKAKIIRFKNKLFNFDQQLYLKKSLNKIFNEI